MLYHQIVFFLFQVLLISKLYVTHGHIENKLNVVIFFSKIDIDVPALKYTSKNYINLQEKARVKIPIIAQSVMAGNEKPAKNVQCEEILKNSLTALIHFCRTVLDMKTAMASITTEQFSNVIRRANMPTKFKTTNKEYNKYRHRRIPNVETIPSLGERFQIPDIEAIQPISQRLAKNIVTGPKHREVFKIRTKRERVEDKGDGVSLRYQVEDFPLDQRSAKEPWDVLGVMKNIRYSFLANLLSGASRDEEGNIDPSNIGKTKKDPGLFRLIASTLSSLQESDENNFLMVIMGGHLNDVHDENSPLMQGIKYVIETTEPNSTLIVVTGSCPRLNYPVAQQELTSKTTRTKNDLSLPIYATGPNSDILRECNALHDVPLIIRKILEIKNKHRIFQNLLY